MRPAKIALTQLIRPEALRGKACARLSHPLLLAKPSLKVSLGLALVAAIAVVIAVVFLPITNAYRGAGIVSSAMDTNTLGASKGHASAGTTIVTVLVPVSLANLVNVGQLARVWPASRNHGSGQGLSGVISLVEQRISEGYRGQSQQPSAAPRSLVAHIRLDLANLQHKSADLRPGVQVDVEIIFGSTPLYRSLLPRRVTNVASRAGQAFI